MNLTLGSAWIAALLAIAPASPSTAAVQHQGLRRLGPSDAGEFQAEGWAERLGSADLDRRERAFEQIVQLGRRDDAARDWLREHARDASASDLAWTCRLALREVERSSRDPLDGRDGRFGGSGHDFFHGFGDPFGSGRSGGFDPDRMRADFERMMEDMERGFGAHRALPPGGAAESRREVSIQIDEDGALVKVTTQDADGQEKTEEFRAETLDEILREHPELREQIGVIELGPGSHSFRFGQPPAQGATPFPRPLLPLPRSGTDARGEPRTDVLGVYVETLTDEDRADLELDPGVGLRVAGVLPGSIAAALGLREGDTLVEVGGRPVTSSDEIGAALRARAPDGELGASWIDRDGQRRVRAWRPMGPKPVGPNPADPKAEEN